MAAAAVIIVAVSDLPMLARRTLIRDQGAEMAGHDLIAHLFPEGVFFANPGSPWQRGTNENTVSLEMPPECRVGQAGVGSLR